MRQAARAIIIEDNKILVIARDKEGDKYFTLPGGKVNDGETTEQALVREIQEETKLLVTQQKLVFIEEHPEPYNQQYIYLCEVAPHGEIGISETAEESFLNQLGFNTHTPLWVYTNSFGILSFRTPQLRDAILNGLKKGFPDQPIKL